MKALLQLISEDNGGLSSTRVVMFFILAWALIPSSLVYIHTGVPQKIDLDTVLLVVGWGGVKVAQKGREQKVEPVTEWADPNTPC